MNQIKTTLDTSPNQILLSNFLSIFIDKWDETSLKINTDKQRSAVMCLVFAENDQLYILLTKRSETLSRHPGEICFPGGKVELEDKNFLDSALRETYEEVGITSSEVNVIGRLDELVTGTGFHVIPFIGIIKSLKNLRLDEREVSEIIKLPLNILANKSNRIKLSKNFNNKNFTFWKIIYLDYNIWGATASILLNLASKVYNETYNKIK